jgi:hypothetical protein
VREGGVEDEAARVVTSLSWPHGATVLREIVMSKQGLLLRRHGRRRTNYCIEPQRALQNEVVFLLSAGRTRAMAVVVIPYLPPARSGTMSQRHKICAIH